MKLLPYGQLIYFNPQENEPNNATSRKIIVTSLVVI